MCFRPGKNNLGEALGVFFSLTDNKIAIKQRVFITVEVEESRNRLRNGGLLPQSMVTELGEKRYRCS